MMTNTTDIKTTGFRRKFTGVIVAHEHDDGTGITYTVESATADDDLVQRLLDDGLRASD